VYVPKIDNRMQGLEWLEVLGKGKHLEGNLTHLRKALAMIIEPHSPGVHRLKTSLLGSTCVNPATEQMTEYTPVSCSSIPQRSSTLKHSDSGDEQPAPFMSAGTSLVVDGEAIPYKRVYVEVHPSLCKAIVV
jgi:hypothetical protein